MGPVSLRFLCAPVVQSLNIRSKFYYCKLITLLIKIHYKLINTD
jgi:hypothetical protein